MSSTEKKIEIALESQKKYSHKTHKALPQWNIRSISNSVSKLLGDLGYHCSSFLSEVVLEIQCIDADVHNQQVVRAMVELWKKENLAVSQRMMTEDGQ